MSDLVFFFWCLDPNHPELSTSYRDMASKLLTFTFTLADNLHKRRNSPTPSQTQDKETLSRAAWESVRYNGLGKRRQPGVVPRCNQEVLILVAIQ